MSSRRVKYNFKAGENVLCFEPDSSKAKVLYDAKILDVSVSTDKKGKRKPSYLIHFLGWNNSWDRVVPESFLLKNTDDNRVLMKKLETISHRIKSNKLRMKKIDSVLARFFQRRSGTDTKSLNSAITNEEENTNSSEDEEEDEEDVDAVESNEDLFSVCTETSVTQSSNAESSDVTDDDEESEANDEGIKREPVCLDLSEPLKRKLERDCYLIKRQKKRLKLPANPNVVTILEGYVKCFAVNVLCASPEKQRLQHQLRSQKQQAPDKSIQLCKEMVDGFRVFFDFTLPLCLLYESEMAQFKEMTELSLTDQKPGKTGAVEAVDSKLNPGIDLHSTRQKHKSDLSGIVDSDDAHSTLSDTVPRPTIKKATEERESPARRVTRHSSGTQGVVKRRFSAQSNKSPARGSVSKIGGAEKGDDEPPHRSERETRQSCARARLEVALPSDPPVIEDVRSSLRAHPGVKMEHSESTHPPCLHFESDTSEVSSHVSQLLSRPEIRAAYSQKEKEVSSVFAWKLVPDELQAEVPVPPSFIYGAHHLLRLFVPLPDLLSRMEIPSSVQSQLVKHLQLFLDHLTSQCEELFPESSYVS